MDPKTSIKIRLQCSYYLLLPVLLAYVRVGAGRLGENQCSYYLLLPVLLAYVRVGAGRLGGECVKDDMNELGLHSEWVVFRDMWRSLIS